ncbi:MAG: hypothetical protein EXR58_00470 [Chloroflexi bacterium]|nr:hypothetical protein [Chloroflexota bacterium]
MRNPRPGSFGAATLLLLAGLMLAAACSSAPQRTAGATLPKPTPIPTAPIFVNPTSRQPIWPTPPVWCRVSPVGDARPDLAPTIGDFPVWLAARPLPVLPWRNNLVRSVWVVDRSVTGDLVLTGRQTDGPAALDFIREGSGSPTSQLIIQSAPRIGSTSASPTAPQFADIQVFLSAPQPGCYEISSRLGDYVQTYTLYFYN